MNVRRGFCDIPGGQVHYRTASPDAPADAPPLIMLHASPGSSKMIEPLVGALGRTRTVFAPDTLGNGDSSPADGDAPEISQFADAVLRLADGLGFETFDLYGTHTGARMATHLGLTEPARVRRIILDGFGVYTPDQTDEILKVYAPAITPDQMGGHVMWAWHFCRDQYIYFPWFKKDAEHRVPLDLPSAEFLHAKFVEISKAITTYHKSYRAAFRYSMRDHVPGLAQDVMITYADTDMVSAHFDEARKLLPDAHALRLPGIFSPEAVDMSAKAMAEFLDR